MTVAVLAEHADEPISLGRTAELVLLQDLVEIHAGDTPLCDSAAGVGQKDREVLRPDKIFGLLPADRARRAEHRRRPWRSAGRQDVTRRRNDLPSDSNSARAPRSRFKTLRSSPSRN